MSLKINNETITTSELEGANENLSYFNTALALLAPNSNVKLLGSPLQRQQLKRMVDSNIPYALNYESKISNIANPGDNTELFSTLTEYHKIISNFSTSNYIRLNNTFKPSNSPWEIYLEFTRTSADAGDLLSKYIGSTYYGFRLGVEQNGVLFYYIPTNSSTDADSYIFPIPGNGTFVTELNTKYRVKLLFTGTTYEAYISKVGEPWVRDMYTENTTVMYDWSAYTNIGYFEGSNLYTHDSIDLTKTYIKVGDTYFFNGETAVENTDYTLIGSPTITTESVTVYHPSPFTFSFDINSSTFTQGTKYLLEHPNLMKVKTEKNDLYFNFPWKNSKWYYPRQAKQFYAYTNGSEIIYAEDENLVGTYKALNTNDFTNNGITIDENGIASGFNMPSNTLTLNQTFNPDQYASWEINVKFMPMPTDQWFPLFSQTVDPGNLPWQGLRIDGVTPSITGEDKDVLAYHVGFNTYAAYWESTGTLEWNVEQWNISNVSFTGANPWHIICKLNGQIDVESDVSNPYDTSTHNQPTYIGTSAFDNRKLNGKIDLKETWYSVAGQKKTCAILNTTSNLYDSNFQQITSVTAENYNNVVIVDGTTYTRDSSKDKLVSLSVLQEGTNSISLIASDSQGGETEFDQIKLIVNNHNFTLVASGEYVPAITTGVLGYKENLVF